MARVPSWRASALGAVVGLLAVSTASAQISDIPSTPPGNRRYSPYPAQTFPNQVLFGDTHLHTSYSTDAGMIGNRLGPEAAYRFARGETVTSSTGVKARLARPLDFLVIADHAENLGLAPAIAASNPELLKNPWGRMEHDLVQKGDIASVTKAYDNWMAQMGARTDPLKEQTALARTMWQQLTAAAEQFNAPGRFTALIGFEWTSNPDGNNLHRNVVFRDGKARADTIVPFSQYDSVDPEDLWAWMDTYERRSGGRLLAIPHNGNLSNGLMFDDVTLTSRQPFDRDYASRRQRWEPLFEVTQMKGDGETHPLLSSRDEFADFETWDKASFGPQPKTTAMLPKEYARQALQRGLAYEAALGVNPFKFGMIGSSDSHTSLSTTQENNFFGKVTVLEPSADPIRFEEVIAGRPAPKGHQIYARQTSASGLAAVWARENTREAIWDAMARKEVYATTGTRMRVRVFAGYGFSRSDLSRSDFAAHGYAKGVPMGGDLKASPAGKAPTLLVVALRDPDGANLDRLQIVKGWLDASGTPKEQVFDAAWSGSRKPGPGGKLPPVGNTVNVKEASYSNAIGAPYLATAWTDPAFDPKQKAFYYVRVLEIPTPRWTTYDARFFGVALPKDVPASLQERAYTSPIWYSPS
ncbi:DUF3604 domain-containing protein [Cyanobium sp. NIES-981]|uniref:DUF3604 domain-containing protein n=1 Tax=Cyanobium sp. NIES-981 TaxID=1851505 RepID=UPI001CEDCE55|nr:DUF3604 domain-containing protein [Cyanobium sp. NIES-981]